MKHLLCNSLWRVTRNDENNSELKFSSDFLKRTFSLTIFALIVLTTNAQTWQWAKSAGGSSYDGATTITTDISGNIYVTGYFWSSSITFGSTILNNANSPTSDMFLVKYDAAGNVLWAKSAGGTGGLSDDRPTSVTTDAWGNVYVVGFFSSDTIVFGSTTLIITNSINNIYSDMFLVKYDASGNVLWAKSAGGTGGTGHDVATSVITDASGNIFVGGNFSSYSIAFGSTTLNNMDISGSTADMFLVKYNSAGNVLWAKSAGGIDDDIVSSITVDASGNVYVSGGFYGPTASFAAIILNNAGHSDMFLVKYNAAGNVLWAKQQDAGGVEDYDYASSVTTDAYGNVYVVGEFASYTITFGSTTLNNVNTNISPDIFLAKYDAAGNVLWAKSAGGSYGDVVYSVTTDASGNVYVAGSFVSDTITFGTLVLTNASSSGIDIFLAKYDLTGNVIWAKKQDAGGLSDEYAKSVTTDVSGSVYVAGEIRYSSITFGSTTLNNSSGGDMFIAKLDGVTGIEENNFENEITVYPNPTSGTFTIQLATGVWQLASGQKQEAGIEIYNVMGEKVYAGLISASSTIINFDVPIGMYFYQVNDKEKILDTGKLIIQR